MMSRDPFYDIFSSPFYRWEKGSRMTAGSSFSESNTHNDTLLRCCDQGASGRGLGAEKGREHCPDSGSQRSLRMSLRGGHEGGGSFSELGPWP